MSLVIVIGAQWGDEGKGRITDLLAGESDVVARYGGGDNAGHTVTVGERLFKLHLIPSGIVHPGVLCVLGSGMVINPLSLAAEIDNLGQAGIEINPQRLQISHLAHLITPAHRYLDRILEEARGKGGLGTTGRGIGPAYTDKARRAGIRAHALRRSRQLQEMVLKQVAESSAYAEKLYGKLPLDAAAECEDYLAAAARLAPYVKDTGESLRQALRAGQRVLAEGAQGVLLDVDYGTYPFVTSSSTIAPGAFGGLGIGILQPGRVIGVTKAFQTRVGAGPFPTELSGELGTRLRGTGSNPWDEFGATTGRPRRVGWHDGRLLRYAVEVNGLTELAVTKLDILSGLPELRVCWNYLDCRTGRPVELFDLAELEYYQPLYETLPGWQQDIRQVSRWQDLPREAQEYLAWIERCSGAPVRLVSVGPERSQYFERHPDGF